MARIFGTGLLQTRLGRRLLLLFVLCALVPVSILAIATYRGVAGQLSEQARERSREASKRVGIAIMERLDLVALALAQTAASSRWEDAADDLGALTFVQGSRITPVRGRVPVPPLSAAQQEHLDRDGIVLVVAADSAPGRGIILLAHRASRMGRPGVLWAAPPENLVQRVITAEENTRLGISICVFQLRGPLIYCPSRDAVAANASWAAGQASGWLEWRDADNGLRVAGYWSLFLDARFASSEWQIVYSQEADRVFAPLIWFRRTFWAAAFLALLVVGLMSNIEIRRTLGPLRALHEATERIADRNFGTPVEVSSGDELEELAGAFNGMSSRLRTQFAEAQHLTEALQEASDEVGAREAQLRAVLDSAADGIVVVGAEGRIESFNPQAERLFGLTTTDAAGRDLAELIGMRVDAAAALAGADASRGGTVQLTARRGDGSTFPAEVAVGRAEWDGRAFDTVFVRDISDRKRAEEERTRLEAQLRQAQKMETIGTLAGGIAHDFNNILTPIIGTLELVLADAELERQVRTDLDEVSRAALRAKDLVRQILTFSRRTEQQLVLVQPGALVQEALKFLRSSLPAEIEISSELAPGLPHVMGDATQLHQVVMNLCTNAWHAMRDTNGGRGLLEVRLEMAEVDAALSVSRLANGRAVRLSIRDTGCGMNQATLERLFEPFFTTKAPGEGTGLGMSIVHGIVTAHGGAIVVDSAPGRGTRFDIYLPPAEEVAPAVVAAAPRARRGEGRVLVVDDDSVIANLIARVLKRAGYDAVPVTSPGRALQLIDSDAAGFDLVITDHSMPELTGLELARRIRDQEPALPLILLSGYAELGQQGEDNEHPFARILVKPVDIGTLTATVGQVLAQSRAESRISEAEEALL